MSIKKNILLLILIMASVTLFSCSNPYSLDFDKDNIEKIVIELKDKSYTLNTNDKFFSFAVERLNSLEFTSKKKVCKCFSPYVFKVFLKDDTYYEIWDSGIKMYDSNGTLIEKISKWTYPKSIDYPAQTVINSLTGGC